MSDGYAERLSAVNKTLSLTDIKGREYAAVNQRILAFWSLFPNGRIFTIKESDDGERCDFACHVYRDYADEKPVATGHAFEMKNQTVRGRDGRERPTINATSYIENCETSAIGRALGLLGIGATTAIASAEEVLNAMAQQEAAKPAKTQRQAPKPAKTQTPPADQAREAANDDLQAAKARLWNACKAYGDKVKHDPNKIADGCLKRTDKPGEGSDAKAWVEWYSMVASEFEQEVGNEGQ